MVKGKKIAQFDKKLCLSHSVSGTIPHMIAVFGTVHKIMMSPAVFLIFSKIQFFFLVFRGGGGGGKRAKKT